MRRKDVVFGFFMGLLVGLAMIGIQSSNVLSWKDLNIEFDAPMVETNRVVETKPTVLRAHLDNIIGDQVANVTGDPQFLLDFAIVAHGKCGTSTMMQWLGSHNEVQIFQYEVRDLFLKKPAKLIHRLYTELPEGPYKRGYKSPQELRNVQSLRYFAKYWPKTKLIVGIRHPVRWFESLYNFRVNNYKSMPKATDLIGRCTKEMKATCTDMAKYHVNLSLLRKISLTREQASIYINADRYVMMGMVGAKLPNPVFLYDVSELADTDEERSRNFRRALQEYLGLEEELPPTPHYKPGRKWDNATQMEKDKRKINICDSEFVNLRDELMGISVEVSIWLREHFLKHPDVYVASREHMQEILFTYMRDPCGEDS